jgi:prepilin-type N-terminal cleavage/methylation domain-containing protein
VTRASLRSQAGFTLTEMLIASAVMISVTAGVFTVLNPSQGTFQAQPEVADMQQRLRVAIDNLKKDLIMAGAGSYTGGSAGALYNYFAPIYPYRRGTDMTVPAGVCDDAEDSTLFCHDTISIVYVPPTPAQTAVTGIPGSSQSEINVTAQNNCGPDHHDALCGFEEGMRVLVMDIDGSWDLVTLTNVQDEAKKLQHHTEGDLMSDYDSGTAIISQVQTHTYYLKADEDTETFQLMHYDGDATDVAIVDNVVDLAFEYFGDPAPPTLLPSASLSSTVGPWTTYGPKPPTTGESQHGWPDGENCVFKMVDGAQVPRLDTLVTGTVQVKLDPAILDGSDEESRGAWCPNAESDARFDADLLRIRRVRVTLRVQAALAALRGPAGILFTRAGTSSSAERFVPDQEIKFDVTPRNMNLGR